MRITKSEFGVLKTGEKVIEYTLKNNYLEVKVLNYGGIIRSIMMSDKSGIIENIVLSYKTIKEYEEKSPYFGAIIGRMSGRIENAEFSIDNKVYKLSKNENKNNLHGGKKGLDKIVWDVKKIDKGIELRYLSPHLTEGFPGEIKFRVKYLLEENNLKILYEGVPDRKTIMNLTNHTYFNLNGNAKDNILDHKLQINSEKVFVVNKESIPYEVPIKVFKTPFDFRSLTKIKEKINLENHYLSGERGYNHPFLLDKSKNLSVILKSEKSGRKLEIYTTEETAVIYTGNYLDEIDGIVESGMKLKRYLGICIETQEIPNKVNFKKLKSKIFTPEKKYYSMTNYKFILEKEEIE